MSKRQCAYQMLKYFVHTNAKVFLEILPSIHEVHRKYGVARNTIQDSCLNLRVPKGLIFRFHGDSLDTIGSCKPTVSKEVLNERATHYRAAHGKAVDIYDPYGKFIETLPALISVHEKYNLSESTIRKGLKEKVLSGGYFFRYAGEELGDINSSKKYCSKSPSNNNLSFCIYENDILIDVVKYKKDMIKYAQPREKTKLQNLLTACQKDGDNFVYHNYFIKFEIAPRNSNISSVSRQLDDNIKGTNNISANGEA